MNTIDHTETDKAFDEKFFARNGEMKVETFLDVKQFIHHRIELEVEKAVKAHAYKIKSILEKENYSNDACIYEIIKYIDSLNK